jgi:hypothetical protein
MVRIDTHTRERKLAHIGFTQHHGSSVTQALDHRGILLSWGFAFADHTTSQGGFACHVQIVFERDAHPMKIPMQSTGLRRCVALLGTGERGIGIHLSEHMLRPRSGSHF